MDVQTMLICYRTIESGVSGEKGREACALVYEALVEGGHVPYDGIGHIIDIIGTLGLIVIAVMVAKTCFDILGDVMRGLILLGKKLIG